MPAKAGIQKYQVDIKHWTPASAGVTRRGDVWTSVFTGVTRRSDVWIPAHVPVCPGPDPGPGFAGVTALIGSPIIERVKDRSFCK